MKCALQLCIKRKVWSIWRDHQKQACMMEGIEENKLLEWDRVHAWIEELRQKRLQESGGVQDKNILLDLNRESFNSTVKLEDSKFSQALVIEFDDH